MRAHEIFSVEGRSVIVTGASAGLGERFARVLATNGAHVLAVARRLEKLELLAKEHPNVFPHRADLSDEGQRPGVIEAALERFGSVDVLVNNAGFGRPRPALAEPVGAFRSILELNLVAVFELARLAARSMVERGSGSIINLASILGLVASHPFSQASYTASKGAIVNMTRELACQWAARNVRVNAIAPGFFPSESTVGVEAGQPAGDYILPNCPMGRVGAEHELDGVLLFLASDASTYCTGQTLIVDGGWTAR